ncbi:unnamed protein product [Brachionus calyciflorus]|uniref:Uncharacterized protein n=1 Tax=Brachionus calyciflorus TaxID=104777 RepID=A0A814A943_9BILA|nr:unnamed protein product [Brachionus calyciflorus]
MKRKTRSSTKKKTNSKKLETSLVDHKSDDLNSEGVSKDSNSDNACDYQSLTDSDKFSLSSTQDHSDRLLIVDESNDVLHNEYSCSSSNSTSNCSDKKSYLFVELKLISVDKKCSSYKKLEKDFLCIGSEANASHVKSYLNKKTNISPTSFDVLLMCNGYEVKPNCPLYILKNNFFAEKDVIVIYYAIVECESNSK